MFFRGTVLKLLLSNTERFSSDSDILFCGDGLVLLKEAEPQDEFKERFDHVPLMDPGLEEVWLKELLVELSSLEVRVRPV